jgi:hypothetical protein
MNIIEYEYDAKKSINTQQAKKKTQERERNFNRKIRFSPTRSFAQKTQTKQQLLFLFFCG